MFLLFNINFVLFLVFLGIALLAIATRMFHVSVVYLTLKREVVCGSFPVFFVRKNIFCAKCEKGKQKN